MRKLSLLVLVMLLVSSIGWASEGVAITETNEVAENIESIRRQLM